MNLDLVDREGKYSNGFCHWPQCAWQSATGWVPSKTNFTSLATPSAVGSGHTAIATLMHEAGHAAHFANVVRLVASLPNAARAGIRWAEIPLLLAQPILSISFLIF